MHTQDGIATVWDANDSMTASMEDTFTAGGAFLITMSQRRYNWINSMTPMTAIIANVSQPPK